ncbi:AraC family transcriptional regulator [Halomonas sp. I1]|uniref:AraC family transcriptional regulator n=1 Tax=Halomonas sp. I1 TaxID=393536 RepID=UPI0028DE9867|nr:AraC family transcriptional regulator [Halomonas sp. I1]MDT8895221.1 AraC family transcriptional regulator [Halomonas sp. I1]
MTWILQNTFHHFSEKGLAEEDPRGSLTACQAALIRDYLNENLEAPIQLEDLSELANLSRFHFLRKFKNTFGQTPHAYLTQIRLGRAHSLLEKTDEKVMMIALECGYTQHSQFTQAFKRHYGYPPATLRKRLGRH